MGEIIKLPRRNAAPSPLVRTEQDVDIALRSAEQSTRLLGRDAIRLVQNLEESLGNLLACIGALPDAEAARQLAADHAELSTALAETRATLASLDFDRTDGARAQAAPRTGGSGTVMPGKARM